MRKSFSLATYTVRVRNVLTHSDETVDAFDDGNDLLQVISDYFNELKATATDNPEDRQVISLPKLDLEGRRVLGTIETGSYGLESNIYNVKKKSIVYKRSEDEADMLPFFFLFEIPEGTDEAILILQRTGNYGIRKILHSVLAPRFQEHFPDLRLRIDPLVPAEQIKSLFKEGRVTQIRFVRYGLTSDLADYYEGGHKEKTGRMELVAYARRGDHFNLKGILSKALQGKFAAKLFSLEEIDFEYDTVKVGVAKKGRSLKQVDLGNLGRMRSYRDITENVKLKSGGHPEFQSIKSAAIELLNEIKGELYGKASAAS